MKKYNILFLCSHNTARSIIGEALASSHRSGKFVGYSAGSSPATEVNPFSLELIKEMDFDQTQLRSKNWEEFALPNAPQMDFIITVCDQAAKETCPYWPGKPTTAHWGFSDPAQVQGSDDDKRRAFKLVLVGLAKRIDILSSLSLESLDALSLNAIHQQV